MAEPTLAYHFCPFCNEDDFDIEGLANHIRCYCEEYSKVLQRFDHLMHESRLKLQASRAPSPRGEVEGKERPFQDRSTSGPDDHGPTDAELQIIRDHVAKKRAAPPLCRCGHEKDRHHRDEGDCLQTSGDMKWGNAKSCPCPKYEPAEVSDNAKGKCCAWVEVGQGFIRHTADCPRIKPAAPGGGE